MRGEGLSCPLMRECVVAQGEGVFLLLREGVSFLLETLCYYAVLLRCVITLCYLLFLFHVTIQRHGSDGLLSEIEPEHTAVGHTDLQEDGNGG